MIINKLAQKLSLFIILIVSISLNAQEIVTKKVIPKLEYQAYVGGVIIHHPEMKHLDDNPYLANELRLAFQTTGTDYWHHTYNMPIYGIGAYTGTYNYDVIGNPRAFFAFIELPFARKENSYFSTSWSGGICYNLNAYDSISNPENIAIGSPVNIYIDFSLMYKRTLSERFQLGGGLKLQHFSNGSYSKPNLGLNMASAAVSLSYLPGKNIQKFYLSPEPDSYDDIEVITMVACGWKAYTEELNDTKYFNSTVSASINKRVNQKRTVGVGFDYFYQSYLINYYEDKSNVTDKDLMSYAGFLSSELILNKFRITTQLGFYMYRPVDFGLFFYERLALRYYPTNWMYLNLSIKAHAAKAEFLEYGLGFKF